MPEQLKGLCIHPLNVIKKEDERVFRLSKRAEELSESQLEADLRFPGWEIRNRGLRPRD